MEKQEGKTPLPKRLKIMSIVLSVLLILSAGGLAARMIYLRFFAPVQATVAVPDNLIGDDDASSPAESGTGTAQPPANETDGLPVPSHPAEADRPTAARLQLYAGKPGDRQTFEVRNMFPGDVETRYFCVNAYHDADITLFFKADITGQTQNLGDALHIKVTHIGTGEVLCSAPFHEVSGMEFPELLKAAGEEATAAWYQVDVSLDPSVGNAFQAARLTADFTWYVQDEDENNLTALPQTGEPMNIALWSVLAASALLLLLLALRRGKAVRHA